MGPGELLQQRLRCGQVREALGILEAMDWSIMGDECYRGLSSVTNHLLRLELNAEREGGSLGHFFYFFTSNILFILQIFLYIWNNLIGEDKSTEWLFCF